jgi:ParB family chromosome partitioning protein
LKLPTDIQKLIETDKLSFGHARALLAINDPMVQRRLAHKIAKHKWSVRETEQRVKNLTTPSEPRAPKPSLHSDPNVRAAEAKLRRALSTQVRIQPATSGTPGRIEIEYYSMEDLDRVYTVIMGEKEAMVASK